jgi:hypothetical protein
MSVNRAVVVLNLWFKSPANLKQSEIYRHRLHQGSKRKNKHSGQVFVWETKFAVDHG